MLKRISDKFYAWAKGWLVLLFVALDALFMILVMPMTAALMKDGTGLQQPLDLRFFTPPQTVFAMLEQYGPAGRDFYRVVELSVDIIYPVVYTLAFGLLISWLFQRALPSGSPARLLNVLPLGAWLFDLLENLGIVALLSLHPDWPAALAWLVTLLTMVKWLFAGAGMLLVLAGLVLAARNGFRRQS